MSKAVSFAEDFFGSPEADPLNQTDLSSTEKASSAPREPTAEQQEKQERGLDSVFAPSSSFSDKKSPAAGLDMQQKAVLIVRTARMTRGLDELNQALSSGWRLMQVTLVGDSEKNAPWLPTDQSDAYFSALVFVEHANRA